MQAEAPVALLNHPLPQVRPVHVWPIEVVYGYSARFDSHYVGRTVELDRSSVNRAPGFALRLVLAHLALSSVPPLPFALPWRLKCTFSPLFLC